METDIEFLERIEKRVTHDPRGRFEPADIERLVALAKSSLEVAIAPNPLLVVESAVQPDAEEAPAATE
jgi:hypothetical protein